MTFGLKGCEGFSFFLLQIWTVDGGKGYLKEYCLYYLLLGCKMKKSRCVVDTAFCAV